MIYSIPVNKVEKLKKIINRYRNKGANITFNLLGKSIKDGILRIQDPKMHTFDEKKIKIECQDVEVDGSYKINDWQFVGIVEFKSSGNIIRLADSSFEGEVPDRYKHTAPVCEHCHINRARTNCYLVYNSKTDEFKQVGSTCLLDYTEGMDANTCASTMSCLEIIRTIGEDEYVDSDDFFGDGFNHTGYGLNAEEVKKLAISTVKKYGYKKSDSEISTKDILSTKLLGTFKQVDGLGLDAIVPASDEEVKEIDNFAENIDDNNSYMHNAKVAWLSKDIEYRDFGFICSFVNTFLKYKEKEKQLKANQESSANEYVGEVGDKIQFTVSSARVLYIKDNSGYGYGAAPSYVWELKDSVGHTYIWSTTYDEINEGDTIKAAVKKQQEYMGIKQTIITRGRKVM